MSRARRAGRLAWVVALVPACFRPSYDRPACSTSGECPGNLVCSAQSICEPPGTVMDASVTSDASIASDASIDASTTVDARIDAPPPASILSCRQLLATCGASGDDSCCHSVEVPGGRYHRSFDRAPDKIYENMSFSATISTFRLDKYEVTVGRFRAFVNAGMGTQASPPAAGDGAHGNIVGSGWNTSWNTRLPANRDALLAVVKCGEFRTWTDAPGVHESRPMNCVSWYEAMAFCAWDGGFLPTEAEWNYAASGGDAQRAFPWSDPPGALLPLDNMHASYNDGTTCIGDGMAGCAVTDLVKVGTKPDGDGRWGHSDLAGNAWEWALDYFRPYRTGECMDCAELSPGTNRVIRGGSFFLDATNLRASYRTSYAPADRTDALGVRCARTFE